MSKYNARKTIVDGITFDSQAEARRYGELKLMQGAGLISGLQCHPKFEILPAFTYKGKRVRAVSYNADLQYIENKRIVVEDVKGGKATQTAVFRLKWKLAKHWYPYIDWRIVEV